MIQFSNSAIKEIVRLKLRCSDKNTRLRLTLTSGGCLEFSYSLTFDDSLQPIDEVHTYDTFQVVVDSGAQPYLENLLIDYSEDMMGGGFRFHNSKAAQLCSCGNSFSVN